MHLLAIVLQDSSNQPSPEMISHMVMAMMAIIPLLIIISIAIVMIPCWFILKKAGFSPWLCTAVPDTVTGHAGAAVCTGVCGVEGRSGAAGWIAATVSATTTAAVYAPGVRQLT